MRARAREAGVRARQPRAWGEPRSPDRTGHRLNGRRHLLEQRPAQRHSHRATMYVRDFQHGAKSGEEIQQRASLFFSKPQSEEEAIMSHDAKAPATRACAKAFRPPPLHPRLSERVPVVRNGSKSRKQNARHTRRRPRAPWDKKNSLPRVFE